MSNLAYVLDSAKTIWTHGHGRPMQLRDGGDEDYPRLAVQIRSGDYFATLATTLDEVSQTLEHNNEVVSKELQRIVSDLLYLQRTYTIIRKDTLADQ